LFAADRVLDSYRSLGVERTVFASPDFSLHSTAPTLKRLDALAQLMDRH
jgi:hypothetical protein